MRTYRCWILSGVLGNIVGMLGELVSPLFIGMIIDAILKKDKDEINLLIKIWIIITVSSSVVNGFVAFMLHSLTQRIGYKLRKDVYRSILLKDV